ncbi:MAG: hypothetical protein M1320_01760 [Patescibacteria group bacterium]|nr:hypothetical protein [Patescibacteria group bacterium]
MEPVLVLKDSIRNLILTIIVGTILVGGLAVVEIISQLTFPGLLGHCITLGILLGFIPLVLLKPGIAKPILKWSGYLKSPRELTPYQTGWIFVKFPLLVISGALLILHLTVYNWTTRIIYASALGTYFVLMAFGKRFDLWLMKHIWDEKT